MTKLASVVKHDDEEVWHEARRPVVTATQVRDWAKGYQSHRARILIEKITGVREDLEGIKYIEWGKFREPFLQQWVASKYGIDPVANDLYVCGDDPRWACTPDGYSDTFGIITLSELKTTKHPLPLDSGHYLDTGYDDQMQWEMLVTGAVQVLFAWEQHDDNWDPWPTPLPPEAAWVARDDKRIAVLIGFAEELLALTAIWREAYQAVLDKCVSDEERTAAQAAVVAHIRADYKTVDGLEDRWLFVVGGDLVPETDPLALGVLPEDVAELAKIVLEARIEEAAAAKRKAEAWKRLQELTKEHTDFKAGRDGVAVSWSTSVGTKKVLQLEKMRAKAPSIVKRYEDLQQRYTVEEPTESRTMTVTKQQD